MHPILSMCCASRVLRGLLKSFKVNLKVLKLLSKPLLKSIKIGH